MSHQLLPDWEGVILGLSTRRHGAMSFNRHEVAEVARNRRDFLVGLGLRLGDCVGPELVHGDRVAHVVAKDKGTGAATANGRIPQTDALITNEPGLILTTTHADCAPVYYYSAKKGVIGLAHAGWRGILAGLPAKVVEAIHAHCQSYPDDLKVAIGPTICTWHYPVGRNIADAFKNRFGDEVLAREGDNIHLDLSAAVMRDLISTGVSPSSIVMPKACTFCDSTLSSWRRDRNAVQPMLAFIVLKT